MGLLLAYTLIATLKCQVCKVWLSFQVVLSLEQPYIRETQCNCKVGLGQCNHLIRLLYTLAHFVKMGYMSVPQMTSKTSLPQAWQIPSRALGVSPRTVSSVSVSKLKPAKEAMHFWRGDIESVLPCVTAASIMPLQRAYTETWVQYRARVRGSSCWRRTESSPLLLSPLTSETFQRDLCLPTTQHSLPGLPLPSQPCLFSTVLDDTEACFYGGLTVTQAVAIQLEIYTREQSHSKTWHKVRTNRLTSSSFKRICSRVADFSVLADNLKKKTV